jgi:hypothetical protein
LITKSCTEPGSAPSLTGGGAGAVEGGAAGGGGGGATDGPGLGRDWHAAIEAAAATIIASLTALWVLKLAKATGGFSFD